MGIFTAVKTKYSEGKGFPLTEINVIFDFVDFLWVTWIFKILQRNFNHGLVEFYSNTLLMLPDFNRSNFGLTKSKYLSQPGQEKVKFS